MLGFPSALKQPSDFTRRQDCHSVNLQWILTSYPSSKLPRSADSICGDHVLSGDDID